MLSPLGQGSRSPEAQPGSLRAAEGPYPDVQGGGCSQGYGGPVAGDGERLDEYPASLHRLGQLEVDLVPPGLVVVGQGRLRDGHDRRHQDGQGHHRNPAHAGLPASALQGLGPVVVTLAPSLRPSPCACRTSAFARCGAPCSCGSSPSCAAFPTRVRRVSPSGSAGRGRSAPVGLARAAPLSPTGTPARRRAEPPAGTSAGRRPPGAAADRLSSPPPSPSRRVRRRRPGPCAPRTGRRGRSGMRRRTGRIRPSPPRSAGR